MEKVKNNKGLITFLIGLVLILVAALAYMIGSNNSLGNNVDNNGTTGNGSNETVSEEINLASYSRIYNFFNYNEYETCRDVFWRSNTDRKTLTNTQKLEIALRVNGVSEFRYSHSKEEWDKQWYDVYTISANKIVSQINNLFGDDNGYKHSNETVNGIFERECSCCSVKYNASNNVYEMNEEMGCGGFTTVSYNHRIEKAVKNDDSIVVTEKIYFETSDDGGVYMDLNLTKKIADTYDESKKESYFAQGGTVTYTFKLDKSNNNYYFDNSTISY